MSLAQMVLQRDARFASTSASIGAVTSGHDAVAPIGTLEPRVCAKCQTRDMSS